MIDVTEHMKPFLAAMRARRNDMGLSGRELSQLAGKSATWAVELERQAVDGRVANPQVGRLAEWTTLLDVAEFGLYTVIDGHFVTYPLVGDVDEEEQEEQEGL